VPPAFFELLDLGEQRGFVIGVIGFVTGGIGLAG
jgi:hypothetical protein